MSQAATTNPHPEKRPGVQVQVAAVCGSLRPLSYTRLCLEIVLRGAGEVGAETRLVDLRDYDLIFCSGKDTDAQDPAGYPEGVHRLRAHLQEAHGIILGTPEYHGSFSGVLKNALDLCGFDEFEGKMIGLVGVSAGSQGAVSALSDLRDIGRALHAWVVPEQVAIPQAARQFSPEGRLVNPALEERLLELGRQVARFAFLHNANQSLAFLKAWEKAPPNPGG